LPRAANSRKALQHISSLGHQRPAQWGDFPAQVIEIIIFYKSTPRLSIACVLQKKKMPAQSRAEVVARALKDDLHHS